MDTRQVQAITARLNSAANSQTSRPPPIHGASAGQTNETSQLVKYWGEGRALVWCHGGQSAQPASSPSIDDRMNAMTQTSIGSARSRCSHEVHRMCTMGNARQQNHNPLD